VNTSSAYRALSVDLHAACFRAQTEVMSIEAGRDRDGDGVAVVSLAELWGRGGNVKGDGRARSLHLF